MRINSWIYAVLIGYFCSSLAWAGEIQTVEVWRNLFTLNHGKGIESNTTFLITPIKMIIFIAAQRNF